MTHLEAEAKFSDGLLLTKFKISNTAGQKTAAAYSIVMHT